MQTLPGVLSAVLAAETGSFTAAAARLDLSPAAVSKNVAALEARLGVRLFNRSTRQLALTEEGQRFVAQARPALDLLQAAEQGAQARGRPQGLVRVSCGAGFGRFFVLPLLPAFLAEQPGVDVELSLSDEPVDLLRDGFDLAIRGGSRVPEGMVARELGELRSLLVAAPAYLQRAGTPQHWRELAQHQRIGTRFLSGKHWPWQFRDGRQTITLPPESRLLVSDPDAVTDAALAGLGVAQVAWHHAKAALADGRLLQLLARQHRPIVAPLRLVYPHREHLAPRVRVLVDYLLAALPPRLRR